jgi:hypothetical protein
MSKFKIGDRVKFGYQKEKVSGTIEKLPDINCYNDWDKRYFVIKSDEPMRQKSGHYGELTIELIPAIKKQVVKIGYDRPQSRDLTVKMIKTVRSSTLKNYCYHNKSLTVTFENGGVYMYLNVPLRITNELDHAYSKGSYFSKVIKSTYDFVKLA